MQRSEKHTICKADYERIKLYLNDIKNAKVLTEDYENLVTKMAQGDNTAREELILNNLPYVITIAEHYLNEGLPLEDLIQEGNAGLMTAINKFDYTKNVKFITYATFWIEQKISRAVIRNRNLANITFQENYTINKIRYAKKILTTKLNRKVTKEDLAKYLNLSIAQIEKHELLSQDNISLDAVLIEDDLKMEDIIADENAINPDKNVVDNLYNKEIQQILQKVLSPLEFDVISKRYGFNNQQPMTLRAIKEVLGYSLNYINRVERNALAKLRRPYVKNKIKGLLDY